MSSRIHLTLTKSGLTLCALAGLAVSASAAVIGFDQPLGQGQTVADGQTFSGNWQAVYNGDANNNYGAAVHWYGSPPTGDLNQFEPDPSLIQDPSHTFNGVNDAAYKGGAVWLDGTSTANNGYYQPGTGVGITGTFNDRAGGLFTLSFYVNTEVTVVDSQGQPIDPNNLKGSPAGVLLYINGQQVNSGLTDNAFLSNGQAPIGNDPNTPTNTVWTKYTVSFTSVGQDTITFQDDIGQSAAALSLTNGKYSSNSALADLVLADPVPEVNPLLMAGLALTGGLLVLGRQRFRTAKQA